MPKTEKKVVEGRGPVYGKDGDKTRVAQNIMDVFDEFRSKKDPYYTYKSTVRKKTPEEMGA